MKYITEIPDGSTNGETWARRQNWFTQMDSAVSYTNGVIKKAQYGYNGLGKRVKQSTYESHAGVQEDALNPMKNIQYTLDLTTGAGKFVSEDKVRGFGDYGLVLRSYTYWFRDFYLHLPNKQS